MNEQLKSQISAFVDGELPAEEADFLTRRLGEDPVLRQQAAAYLEIGRLIRGEPSVSGTDELRERIATALKDEPLAAAVAPVDKTAGWLRPLGGVAIAASVAMLALVGLRQLDVTGTDALPSAASTLTADDATGYTEPLAIDVMADRPSDMLMQYYLSHGETSGELGANGILSRLVTLELRGGELVEIARPDNEAESASADDGDAAETTQE